MNGLCSSWQYYIVLCSIMQYYVVIYSIMQYYVVLLCRYRNLVKDRREFFNLGRHSLDFEEEGCPPKKNFYFGSQQSHHHFFGISLYKGLAVFTKVPVHFWASAMEGTNRKVFITLVIISTYIVYFLVSFFLFPLCVLWRDRVNGGV